MKRSISTTTLAATIVLGAGLVASAPLRAEDKPPPKWTDTIKWSGYIDAGIMGNPDSPGNGINFGRLFDDRANSPNLNQLSLTLTRPIDSNATGYDFGFALTGMYGSDVRYVHFLGEFATATKARYQFTPIEADVLFHLPWIGSGGIDGKLGQFPTLLSAEQTPSTANPLFSHSYIFNFGVPIAHTGLWTTTHATSQVDIYLGIDTGNQTTFTRGGDNNDALAYLTGVGFNLLDGNVTILWLNHMGPENPRGAVALNGVPFNVNGNNAWRYEDTVTTVIKWNDDLTFTTDINYIRDTGVHAVGYGIAQYVAYALNDQFTLMARGEVWRDAQGFFVAAFPGSLDPINALAGRANGSYGTGVPTTYGEITLGVNYKPPVPAMFTGAVFRPEIRYDTTLNNVHPFNAGVNNVGTSGHQFTIGADFILPF